MRLLLALWVVFATLLALATAASADAYRPTRTDDPAPNGCRNHNCSLREAVIKANNNPGHDRIVLRAGKTYNLSIPNAGGVDEDHAATGDLDLLGNVTITHSGARRATINGHGVDRVFHFPGSSPPIPTGRLSGLVIRGGDPGPTSGGGLDVDNGHLVLVNSIVTGNKAFFTGGGIDADLNSDSSVSISKSRISGNSAGSSSGGGIWTSTPTTIRKSTVSGNAAPTASGGGITNYGVLTVTGSTIASNHSGDDGGGVDQAGPATFVNDTFTKNSAANEGGGIDNRANSFNLSPATTNLNAVTIARNTSGTDGGGIDEEGGVMNVKNSLIALNQGGGEFFGPDCRRSDSGGIVSQGHNLIGSTSECAGFWNNHDITDVNPRIGTLADNGGPTKTIALLKGSPAIGHADKVAAPSRDQRGFLRDSKPDMGAYERGARR